LIEINLNLTLFFDELLKLNM